MANYIETSTGRYPVSETQIRAENPQTSFPAQFRPPEGFEIVFPAPTPAYDPITQYVREIAPVLTSKGHYEQAYEVLDLDAETIAANQAKAVEQFVTTVTTSAQSRLDTFSGTRRYDDVDSISKYKDLTDAEIDTLPAPVAEIIKRYRLECRYLALKAAQTWATLELLMAEVQAGTRPMPSSVDEVMALLPVLEWPE